VYVRVVRRRVRMMLVFMVMGVLWLIFSSSGR
jgi:hypothetical protein